MIIPEEFDNIRSFQDEEVESVLESLINDEVLTGTIDSLTGPLLRKFLFRKAGNAKSIIEFQKKIIIPLLTLLIRTRSNGLTSDFSRLRSDSGNCLFISNHRDIVMDSAFLDYILLKKGMQGVEIGIGDNLLSKPWIENFVRMNRSFIVRRSLAPAELLKASEVLSRYIHFVIGEKNLPVWIAQREGRAKDSDDRTQKSLLKMLAMGDGNGTIQSLISLNPVPLAISYEYDPCDWLKAAEFQQKRDNPAFKKTREDDLLSMRTGIFGFKGHIHYQTAGCINSELEAIDRSLTRNMQFEEAAKIIDRHIHSNYRIYPCNRVALDMLEGGNSQSAFYTARDRKKFERYIDAQLSKIRLSNPDWDYLRIRILEMYANPLRNNLQSIQQK